MFYIKGLEDYVEQQRKMIIEQIEKEKEEKQYNKWYKKLCRKIVEFGEKKEL